MKLQSFKRLFKQDYNKDDQDLVEKMSYTINPGFDNVYQALNRGLTFDDNFNSNITTFSVKVNSSGTPIVSTVFKTTVKGNIQGMIVISAVNNTSNTVYPTSAPFISFTQNTNIVTVNNIVGLQANNNYTLTVLIIGS